MRKPSGAKTTVAGKRGNLLQKCNMSGIIPDIVRDTFDHLGALK